ncbi:MAG: hypothetical protein IH820_15935 [Bacteroidetes bacterium]|nr:hypothetical protein [Bacteroidota bacterium]
MLADDNADLLQLRVDGPREQLTHLDVMRQEQPLEVSRRLRLKVEDRTVPDEFPDVAPGQAPVEPPQPGPELRLQA